MNLEEILLSHDEDGSFKWALGSLNMTAIRICNYKLMAGGQLEVGKDKINLGKMILTYFFEQYNSSKRNASNNTKIAIPTLEKILNDVAGVTSIIKEYEKSITREFFSGNPNDYTSELVFQGVLNNFDNNFQLVEYITSHEEFYDFYKNLPITAIWGFSAFTDSKNYDEIMLQWFTLFKYFYNRMIESEEGNSPEAVADIFSRAEIRMLLWQSYLSKELNSEDYSYHNKIMGVFRGDLENFLYSFLKYFGGLDEAVELLVEIANFNGEILTEDKTYDSDFMGRPPIKLDYNKFLENYDHNIPISWQLHLSIDGEVTPQG